MVHTCRLISPSSSESSTGANIVKWWSTSLGTNSPLQTQPEPACWKLESRHPQTRMQFISQTFCQSELGLPGWYSEPCVTSWCQCSQLNKSPNWFWSHFLTETCICRPDSNISKTLNCRIFPLEVIIPPRLFLSLITLPVPPYPSLHTAPPLITLPGLHLEPGSSCQPAPVFCLLFVHLLFCDLQKTGTIIYTGF